MENQFDLLNNTKGFGFDNFDPTLVQEESVILLTLVIDISPSVSSYATEMNKAFEGFLEEMQKSHVASKLMVKVIEFNENVKHVTGFTPITNMVPSNFHFRPTGNFTALFEAAKEGLTATVNYQELLEKTGINVKCLVFVMTDGEENTFTTKSSEIKEMLDTIMKSEKNIFNFETILLGVGNENYYEPAQKEMGFKHLATFNNSANEIRKMIGFISQSVSRSSANKPVNF